MKRISFIIASILLVGCGAPKLNADYTIRAWLQTEEKGKIDSLKTVIGWAIEADTVDWTVASYGDALTGRITHRTTGETREAGIEGLKDAYNWSVQFHFTRKPIMIIAADIDRPFYAYHQAIIYGGTPNTILSLVEQAWRPEGKYIQGIWRTFYE